MTTHSLDLRNRVVACYNAGDISIRQVAERFMVNKKTVHQWLQRYREQGNVEPRTATSTRKSQLDAHQAAVHAMVREHPDYTLAEYCEVCEEKTGVRLSESAMCRFLNKENLSRKKTLRASQAGTEAQQEKRLEYWEQIREVQPENLVFLDEMGVLLGLMRTCGRRPKGERLYAKKPFYRGERTTIIGAITQEKVIALERIGKSMSGEDFKQFIQEKLVPQLWKGAVVVMDQLSAHKVAGIQAMVEEVGARIVYLSGYSPEFNPIEHLWWELKAFVRSFVPKSKQVVEALLRGCLRSRLRRKKAPRYKLRIVDDSTERAR